MAVPDYCTPADIIAELKMTGQTISSTDQDLIAGYTGTVSRMWERETGVLTYTATSYPNLVVTEPDVRWDTQGVLRVRTPAVRITTVAAFSYRVGPPTAAWLPVDLSWLDWSSSDPRGGRLVRAYLGRKCPGRAWVQLTYTAGWLGADPDPYPDEIVRWCARMGAWLYRRRETPYEKTANAMTGVVTIPSAMPPDLRATLTAWKRPAVF